MSEEKVYWAFVSYSSKDKRWGEWLHRGLESYPIPPEFQGQEILEGVVLGKNLRPVFRDRDELASSAHLGAAISSALEASHFLVVICSKNSAQSKWVNREIEIFQGLGKGSRILAMIVDGEPNATAAGRPAEECFPPALRTPAEPIAGDLRKKGDGKARGFLKILAGVAQLDFDQLYRRHERAQARRRLFLAGGALALVVTFSGLAGYAWYQQQEADEKKAEAVEAKRLRLEADQRRVEADQRRLEADRLSMEAERRRAEGLRSAGNADLSGALKVWQEDWDARKDGKPAVGASGKSRWHEGVALLARALRRDSTNQAAALWLYDTVLRQGHARRDVAVFVHEAIPIVDVMEWSPDGSRLLASGGKGGAARLWDTHTGEAFDDLIQHESWVDTAVFAADGSRFMTQGGGKDDNSARIWDAATGRPVSDSLPNGRSAILSPDGSRVAVASPDNAARVWDVANGKLVGKPLQYEDVEKPILKAFSPDGSRILTVIGGKTARIWDVATGKPVGPPMQHEDGFHEASFGADGKLLVTSRGWGARADASVRLWNADNGKLIGEPMQHEARVTSVSISPDGRWIATSCEDRTARIWSAETAKSALPPLQHEEVVTKASFSPDGSRLVTASGHWGKKDPASARIWAVTTGSPVGQPLQHEGMVRDVSFSADGLRVLTASGDGSARVWDAATGMPLGEPLRHEGGVLTAAFSPNACRVATETYLEDRDKQAAMLWNVPVQYSVGVPLRHQGWVAGAELSPDGSRVATASGDNTARIWDAVTGEAVGGPLQHADKVNSAVFSGDGSRIVTACADGTARVWDVASGKPLGGPLRHGQDSVKIARFSPDGLLVATGGNDGVARIWNAVTGKPLGRAMEYDEFPVTVQFSPDGSLLLAVGGRSARIWNVATCEPHGGLLEHGDYLSGGVFSHDGSRVVTGGVDKTACIWDVATGRLLGERLDHEFMGEKGEGVESAEFSPDDSRVLTAGSDCTARVWDAHTGKPIGQPMRHEALVLKASYSRDGTRIVTTSADNTARVWDAETCEPLGEPLPHNDQVFTAAFSADGRRVLTASYDQTARLWDVSHHARSFPVNPAVVAWAEAVAGLRYHEDVRLQEIPYEERRAILKQAPETLPGEWKELAIWFNSQGPDRRLQLAPKLSLRQIAERERDFNGVGTEESLGSALQYDYTVPLARLFLANAIERKNAASSPKDRDSSVSPRAAVLRRYDLDQLPADALLWSRAARALLEAPEGAAVGIGSGAIAAKAAALMTAEKAVSLLTNETPDPARMNLAHACLFNGQFDRAQTIYRKYSGMAYPDGRKWDEEVLLDFTHLRAAGCGHPDMARIEAMVDKK